MPRDEPALDVGVARLADELDGQVIASAVRERDPRAYLLDSGKKPVAAQRCSVPSVITAPSAVLKCSPECAPAPPGSGSRKGARLRRNRR